MIDLPRVRHLSELTDINGGWYLASPYSKYPEGLERAFRAGCRIAGRLIAAGVPVFSPIAHSHSVAILSGLNPRDHATWLRADEWMMRAAAGLLVADMDGWRNSFGVAFEIEEFEQAGKPIMLLPVEPEDLQ